MATTVLSAAWKLEPSTGVPCSSSSRDSIGIWNNAEKGRNGRNGDKVWGILTQAVGVLVVSPGIFRAYGPLAQGLAMDPLGPQDAPFYGLRAT